MQAPHANNIEVEGLVRQFKNGPLAVAGIDLRVDPGEIYGFLGPNGAGKSTTVHMLTTLLPPTGGGRASPATTSSREGPQVRGAIGAALQEAALDPHLTAREHMRLQTALHGLPRAERLARGDALIERVGLADAADRKVGGYSGGMKRRLDLALALVHGPRVLFLDEPTTGLDPQSRAALWDEVARLAGEEGVTVFLTTQYLEEADQLADRVGIIDDGKIVAEGTPAALKAEIGRPSLEVGAGRAGRGRSGPRRPRALRRAGARLARGGRRPPQRRRRAADRHRPSPRRRRASGSPNIELHAPSLDDVFLEKTGRHLEGAGDGGNPGADAGRRGRPARGGARVSGAAVALPSPGRSALATRSARSPGGRSCARCASRRCSSPASSSRSSCSR